MMLILAVALALSIDALPIPPSTVEAAGMRTSDFTFHGALSVAFDMTSYEVGERARFKWLKAERQSLEIKSGKALSTAVADTFNSALMPAEMIAIGDRMPGSTHPNELSVAVTGTATFTLALGAPSIVCQNFHLARGSSGRDDNFWLGMPGCAPTTLADTVGLRCACGEQTIVLTPSGGDDSVTISLADAQ